MYGANAQCDSDYKTTTIRNTYSSVDSLISSTSDDSNQVSDGKVYSSEETDSGDTEMNREAHSDSAVSGQQTPEFEVEIDDEKKLKIIEIAEFYLSDDQILKDVFLLKHVRRNKEGYISLKLLSSFKKMKSASKDWREVATALRESKTLEVNESGSKVRRRDALPDYDETSPSRAVLAFNLPFEKPTVADLTEKFSKAGDIVSIRIVNPGTISADVKKYKIKHKALGTTLCAIIEYDSYKSAAKCSEILDANIDGNWREMKVLHIASSVENSCSTDKSETTRKRKRLRPKNKAQSRLSDSSAGYSTSPSLSSSDVEQSAPTRSIQKEDKFHYSEYRRNFTRHIKSNSYSDSRNMSFQDTNLINGLQKRLNSKFPGPRRYSEGTVLGENIPKDRRRTFSICVPVKSAVQVIRNPIGPDGTSGFKPGRIGWSRCPIIAAC